MGEIAKAMEFLSIKLMIVIRAINAMIFHWNGGRGRFFNLLFIIESALNRFFFLISGVALFYNILRLMKVDEIARVFSQGSLRRGNIEQWGR